MVVENPDLDILQGQADRAGFADAVKRVERYHRRRFAEAVTLEQREPHLLLKHIERFTGQGSRAGHRHPQFQHPMQPERDLGLGQCLKNLRDPDEDRGPVHHYFLHRGLEWVNGFDQHDAAPIDNGVKMQTVSMKL